MHFKFCMTNFACYIMFVCSLKHICMNYMIWKKSMTFGLIFSNLFLCFNHFLSICHLLPLPACLSLCVWSGLFGCSRWHVLCCAGVDREAPQRRFWAVIWCAGCRAWDWPATPGRLWCTARVCWREESFNTSLLSMASRMKRCTTASHRGANRF